MTNPLPEVLITRDNIAISERIVESGFLSLWLLQFSKRWEDLAEASPGKYELAEAFATMFHALFAVVACVLIVALLPILAIYWFIGSAVSYRKIRIWVPFAKKHLDSTGAIASLTTEI